MGVFTNVQLMNRMELIFILLFRWIRKMNGERLARKAGALVKVM